jgi:hypothetical protein
VRTFSLHVKKGDPNRKRRSLNSFDRRIPRAWKRGKPETKLLGAEEETWFEGFVEASVFLHLVTRSWRISLIFSRRHVLAIWLIAHNGPRFVNDGGVFFARVFSNSITCPFILPPSLPRSTRSDLEILIRFFLIQIVSSIRSIFHLEPSTPLRIVHLSRISRFSKDGFVVTLVRVRDEGTSGELRGGQSEGKRERGRGGR